MNKNVATTAAVLALCALTSCVGVATYGNLTPTYPKPHAGRSYAPVVVDSLQPTFKWEVPASGRNVDFIIWEAFKSGKGLMAPYDSRGDVVYSKDNIAGGEHHLEKALLPDTVYVWSIRPTGTTPWSTSHHVSTFGNSGRRYFVIKTPKQ